MLGLQLLHRPGELVVVRRFQDRPGHGSGVLVHGFQPARLARAT
jgi:hypothetical protein